MGRTLKRVPLDFDWPLNKVWEGYRTPEHLIFPTCSTCGGDGYSTEARAIADTFYAHSIGGSRADTLAWHDKLGQAEVNHLVKKGRLQKLVRREPTDDNPRDWEWVSVPRTAEEVNAMNRPGARGLDGHDAINRWLLIAFRCKRLGITEKCSTCEGNGDIATAEQRKEAEKDHSVEPPTGDGYQLWETTSEGSPVTPVFSTLEALCEYAAANCSTFGSSTASAEGWRKMLDEDFVAARTVRGDGTTVIFI